MSFLRFIVILGILAIGGGTGYIFSSPPPAATPSIAAIIEKNNDGIARSYINTVWKKYHDTLVPLIADPAQLKTHPEVAQFASDTAQYFAAMPIIRANFYTANGTLLLSAPGNIPETLPLKKTIVPAPDGTLEIISALPILPTANGPNQQYIIIGGTTAVIILLLVFIGLSVGARKNETIITRQHEANLELLKAVEAAQEQARDKSQFLANVSHELRTPLNAIIGFSDVLKNEVLSQLPDKKYENYISDIHMSGTHLLSLINDILDYSKAEAGKLVLEIEEVNANKLVQNSLRLVSPRAETGNITLVETLPKEPLAMMTDSKKFKQILLNLFSNAVKFTPAGGSVTVTASQNLADDTITFEVTDTGIGIAPKDISKAMAPFSQVDNTLKRKYEGTGLGLPLTKKFIELMGGKFMITSEVNKGTKVTFTLPRVLTVKDGVVVKKVA
jgi:signal transduction histidine kinase